MRILFIGAATSNHTIRWVNALSNRNHDVMLVSRSDQRDNKKRISPNVKIKYLKHGGGIGYYLNVFELKRIYKDFKPDVVNAHYATGYGTLARLSRWRPLVLSVWGSDVYDFPWKSARNRRLLCKNLNYADEIASTSFAMAEETRRVLSDPKREITVTPFGVDLSLFQQKNKSTVSDCKIVGIVKYLEPIYDIPLLINAFEILHKRIINTELHIYGYGKLKDKLIELCESKHISGSVKFMGVIPNNEVPKALNSMDVFVNCSKQESFGVAVVEAMACGIPVVATNCEGFKEIIENGKDGIIIENRDPALLSQKISLLLEDRELASSIVLRAKEKIERLYDWSKNVSTMEQLYQDAIKKYQNH